MTCREKLKLEHPEKVDPEYTGGCSCCPHDYGYLVAPNYCSERPTTADDCKKCWDREIPEPSLKQMAIENGLTGEEMKINFDEEHPEDAYVDLPSTPAYIDGPRILDSGNRRQFESGAVRDIQEGKGRCDLLPLDVVAKMSNSATFAYINSFQETNDISNLHRALSSSGVFHDVYTMILEVSKHFEEGAKKYGDNNWRKGIPVRCYIDSAVRHYLKFLRGDKDEPHDRAFCWNIMCAIWTCKHHPELNEYASKEE